MFGNYYAYDAIAPLADKLQRLLGFSDTQLGTLNAIYSFPNIIMVLIGGIIVDRLGRVATLAFTAICRWARSSPRSRRVSRHGDRPILFGLGAETMIVAVTLLGQWFVGRQLGFAFGINLSIARAGSYGADMSTTWAKPLYDQGWQQPLWLAAGITALMVVGCALLRSTAAPPTVLAQAAARPERHSCGATCEIRPLLLVRARSVRQFYSVIFPFRTTSRSSTSSTPMGSRSRKPGR